jgi:hypothetical protein
MGRALVVDDLDLLRHRPRMPRFDRAWPLSCDESHPSGVRKERAGKSIAGEASSVFRKEPHKS